MIEVVDQPGQLRYVISVDGAPAGAAAYVLRGGRRIFVHTEIDPAYEGRGLGSTFVREMLRQVADRGVAVLPYCPFVRAYLQRHRDLVHVVPAGRRAEFGLEQSA